jgi:hypothetical protein
MDEGDTEMKNRSLLQRIIGSSILWYSLFYGLGALTGYYSAPDSMTQSLNILAPVTLTALVASLLVPFAGFSSDEWKQKFIMQYGIVPLFGMYTVALLRTSTAWNHRLIGLLLFVCASSVHFAYWTSGLHSRAYRFKQFAFGFGQQLPKTRQLIASLNGRGFSQIADAIIRAILEGRDVDLTGAAGIFRGEQSANLLLEVKEELEGLARYA